MASDPSKPKARLPRGLTDRSASDIRATERMIAEIRRVYERYGFEPVETPLIEYTDALGKFLPDLDRPNEGVFSFQDDDEQWLSLRYDLTAPLARYVAENYERLPKPYRSYRAGWVFRNEKPGPGRFRQFMQFDADTVGAASTAADAEICMMAADTMEALGIARGQFVIRAELIETSIIDGDGTLLATPDLTAAPIAPAEPFNARNVDAAGLRVGVPVDELEAAIARLYRKPVRTERRPGSTSDARFGGWIEIDLMDCLFVPGSRDREPVPGDVCLRASYDAQGIVRQVRIQRVLPRFDFEQARKAAIDRFGPTATGSMGGTPRLTWGESDPTLGPTLMMTIDPYGNSLSLGNSAIRAGSMDMTLTDIEWAKATPIPAQ